MSISQIAAIVGAITGVISILGIIYAYGFKFGSITTKLKEIEGKLVSQIEFGKLSNQVETLYKVYVIEALPRIKRKKNPLGNPGNPKKNNPNNPKKSPPKKEEYKFPQEVSDLITEKTWGGLDKDDIEIVYDIIGELGASESEVFVDIAKEISPRSAIVRIVTEVVKMKSKGKEIFKEIENFHEGRIEKLKRNETPKAFPEGGKIALHLIPFDSFHAPKEYDLSTIYEQSQIELSPMYGKRKDYNHTYTPDGILNYIPSSNGKCLSYVQLYRSGIIEAVDGFSLRGEKRDIPIYSIEQEIMYKTYTYLLFHKGMGIKTPLICYLSLLEVKGHSITDKSIDTHFFDIHPFEIEDLILPKIIIEEFDIDETKMFKMSFDRIWNACGYPRSFQYNNKGEFKAK